MIAKYYYVKGHFWVFRWRYIPLILLVLSSFSTFCWSFSVIDLSRFNGRFDRQRKGIVVGEEENRRSLFIFLSLSRARLALAYATVLYCTVLRTGLKKCQHRLLFTGAANDGFLLNTLKTLFRLSKVLLVFQKFILIGAIKLAIFADEVFIRHIRLRSFTVL